MKFVLPFPRIAAWSMVLSFFFSQSVSAQEVIGTAVQLSCNCYRLTEAIGNQGGAVWNSNQIDLSAPFDYTFDVYLGDIPGGADGIAFVLQPLNTGQVTNGGGLGYEGITPSLAMPIDTYDNGPAHGDLVQDHVSIMANGSINHNSAENLSGPEIALVSGQNIEDGEWHLMRVSWDPVTMVVDFYMDGSLRTSYTGDIITDIFGGDPMVFWGFTGSTGGLNNRQEFCFSIIPGLTANTTEICQGESIEFTDDSYSALGSVDSWTWDFGDGQTSSSETPGEIQFNTAGNYWVTQTIVDAEGCDASDSLEVVVNSNPEADFVYSEVCEGDETVFTDQSNVASGSLNSWNWDFGDGATGNGANAANTYAAAGTYTTSLLVSSSEGCIDSVEATVTVFENPTAEATEELVSLNGTFTTTLLAGEEATWMIEDTTITGLDIVNYTFSDSGWYDITLTVTNANGCVDEYMFSVYVEGVPEYEVPNVFTPNGDDFNERFQPFTYSMSEAVMEIYNRWGRPVYKFDGAIPVVDMWGWDGTINGGSKANEGTYYYVLDLKGSDGSNFSEHGTVTLVR